jgi:hypothetical protein
MMSLSNRGTALSIMSRCPKVIGSKDPGNTAIFIFFKLSAVSNLPSAIVFYNFLLKAKC